MIPIAASVRIWIASGHTDMRKGMNGLALLVQEGLGRDPFAGDVFVFRGRAGPLIKALWHDGIGLSLYAKRLAGDGGWRGGAECCTDELSVGSDRLEKSTTHLATAERGLGLKKVLSCRKKSPQIAVFVIPSAS
jgi:transposase